jgi:hypothetical protein
LESKSSKGRGRDLRRLNIFFLLPKVFDDAILMNDTQAFQFPL